MRLSPWERCPAGEVRTRLQGHYSPPARATSTHQYRVAPTVDANEIEVSWSQHNRDAIVMRNTGRAFTDYGQPVTITLSFSNGFTTRWNPDTDVTVRPAPGESTVPDNLRWTASITMNEDAAMPHAPKSTRYRHSPGGHNPHNRLAHDTTTSGRASQSRAASYCKGEVP